MFQSNKVINKFFRIYNLVAISIDRYIAIIMPLKYTMLITKFRARCIVAIVWIVSFIICSPSFLLASSEKRTQNNAFDPSECRCTPSNSGMAYILFSASSSFYIPMAIVIFVYMKIYIAACAATKSAYSGMMQVTTSSLQEPLLSARVKQKYTHVGHNYCKYHKHNNEGYTDAKSVSIIEGEHTNFKIHG